MKTFWTTTAAAALLSHSALAGGVDRSGQSIAVIFEEGNYAEFSLGFISPDVSGTTAGALVGVASGDVAPSYTQLSGAYKWNYGGPLDVGIIVDQPFGASVDYPVGTGYPLAGSNATLTSQAATIVASYGMGNGFSLHGGARAQSLEMDVALPGLGYTGVGDRSISYGYLVGAAYERPEIALRVALTYNSAIDHDIATTETGPTTSTTPVTTPQSVNLEFQTGIMADTLLFGSARWVNWSNFDISPIVYAGATGGSSLVDFADDTITYSLGIGRRFSDTWSGAVTVGYEPRSGGLSSNLGPTDGRASIGLGATYTNGNVKVTGGISYVMLGDTDTAVSAAPLIFGNFRDNTTLAAGVKIGITM